MKVLHVTLLAFAVVSPVQAQNTALQKPSDLASGMPRGPYKVQIDLESEDDRAIGCAIDVATREKATFKVTSTSGSTQK